MSGHERERLSAYLDGELAAGERAAVEAHLGACPECTAFLAELAAVDAAAAALPAEAPPGYFERFPARVRARLAPRKAAPPARPVPAWTWAAAAAILLAVITPLTLRQMRSPGEASPHAATEKALPQAAPGAAAKSQRPGTQPAPSEAATAAVVPRSRPAPTVAPPLAAQAPAGAPPSGVAEGRVEGPAREASPPEGKVEAPRPAAKDEAAENLFAREPDAAARRDQAVTRREAPAGVESEGAVGGAPAADTARRDKRAAPPPHPGVAAEAASPALAAAGAGREATPTSLEEPADAFHRLAAARPRSAAGWRRLREQWNALAAADADPARADEARVRAMVAAREAWRAGGDEADLAAFRAGAESYLRRDDARQKPRVEQLLAEP